MYELMASNMALSAMGLDAGSADGDAFGLMMWVMCAGITLPLVLNIFMIKPVHMGAMKLGEKDRRWGQLSNSTFLVALLIALVILTATAFRYIRKPAFYLFIPYILWLFYAAYLNLGYAVLNA